MASEAACEGCGFEWSSVTPSLLPTRVRHATTTFVDLLRTSPVALGSRPAPERWSILEYAAHTRDVLLSIRERIVLASILDEYTGTPIFREERVALGFYTLDTPEEVANELNAASRLFVRTFEALPEGFEERTFTYSTLTPQHVSILWAGAQALHETEHHLADARENERLLGD